MRGAPQAETRYTMWCWLLITVLFCACGYAWVHLLRLSQGNLVTDAALSWFAGMAWFSLASAVCLYAWRLEPSGWLSLALLALPVLVLALRPRHLLAETRSGVARLRACQWWPANGPWLWGSVTIVTLLVLVLIVLHGTNTPTHTDDAMRLRAYTPFLAYRGDLTPAAARALLSNGAVVSFVPLPGWQLSDNPSHFHVNYLILTSLLFFCLLLYASCCDSGRPEQGLGTVFLLTALPLYVYHLTTTYSDALCATFFAGALFFFARHAERRDTASVAALFLFLLLTAMVKNEGEIMALTVLGVFLLSAAWACWRERTLAWQPLAVGLAVLAAYLLVKNLHAPNNLVQTVWRAVTRALEWGVPAAPGSGMRKAAKAVASVAPGRVQAVFWGGFFSSGNYGIIFYLLPAFCAWRWRHLWRLRLGWAVAALLLVAAEVYLNGVHIHPQWTLDQSTLHRSIMCLAVGSAIIVGCLLVPPAGDESLPGAAAGGEARAEKRRRKKH